MSNQCNCIESAKRKARIFLQILFYIPTFLIIEASDLMYSCNKIIRPEFKFPAKFEMAFLKYQPWDANLTKHPKNILDKTAGRILYLLEFLKNFNWRNQIFLIKRASDFSNLESLVEVVSFQNSLKINSDKISFLLQKPDGSGIVQDLVCRLLLLQNFNRGI